MGEQGRKGEDRGVWKSAASEDGGAGGKWRDWGCSEVNGEVSEVKVGYCGKNCRDSTEVSCGKGWLRFWWWWRRDMVVRMQREVVQEGQRRHCFRGTGGEGQVRDGENRWRREESGGRQGGDGKRDTGNAVLGGEA
jgi:hypothetical protein